MTEAILATQGISKSFGALKASDDVSIDLMAGEIHAIIGPNGAGKSTLIKQICGGLKPDTGTVKLLGEDVTDLPTELRARAGLGRTFPDLGPRDGRHCSSKCGAGCAWGTGKPMAIFQAGS
jgi:branched-chain amino acid transport system ATP-binding protein